MLEFLLLLTLFLRPVYSGILLVFGIGTEQLPLSVVYIGVALIDYCYIFIKRFFTYKIEEQVWVSTLVMVALFILQFVTGFKYSGISNGEFMNSILSYVSLSIPAFLMGCMFVEKNDYSMLGKMLPIFIIVLSGVTMYADFSTMKSWDGLVYNENSYNIDYQNCTYYAAYAFGLTAYYLLYSEELQVGQRIQKLRWLFFVLLPVQIFVVLTAGGRGGALLGGFLVVYYVSVFMIKYRKVPGFYLSGGMVLLALITGTVLFFSKNGEGIRGFSRIASFFENPQDSSRNWLYVSAIEHFLNKPIFGNGVGSVWFTVGYYSHNIFCDLLCETGIIGTGLGLIVLGSYVMKSLKMIRKKPIHQFGILIFFFVFIMLLFSGYYLTEPMLWFALAFAFFMDNGVKVSDENTVG